MAKGKSKFTSYFSTCPLCNATMARNELREHVIRCNKKRNPGIRTKQLSQKTIFITKNIICKKCGLVKAATYNMNRNIPPKICNGCKDRPPFYKENSKFDPLDNSVSGGAFEMNRRRH